MKRVLYTCIALAFLLSGCIGDDYIDDAVPAALTITNPLDTLAVGDTWAFAARYTNIIGQVEQQTVRWSSSDSAVLGIDAAGLAMGLAKGVAVVKAEVTVADRAPVEASLTVVVDDTTTGGGDNSRTGKIRSTSSYLLTGDFELSRDGNQLKLSLAGNYQASTALPGLYVYLSNNAASVANALEIGRVTVFNGAHDYTINGAGLNDYTHILYWCKPFNVKVGEGKLE